MARECETANPTRPETLAFRQRALALGLGALGLACAPAESVPVAQHSPPQPSGAQSAVKPAAKPEPTPKAEPAPDPLRSLDTQFDWAPATFSGNVASPGDPDLEPLLGKCGPGDAALHDVAEALAHLSAESITVDTDMLAYLLRKRGAPYVNPETWSAELESSEPVEGTNELTEKAALWLRSLPRRSNVRCGIGSLKANSREFLVLLRAPSFGQLVPIPTFVPMGTRQRLEILWSEPVLGAELLALPPLGAPRRTAIAFSGDRGTAEVTLAAPGEWLLQVMVDTSGGPTPAFLATVNVDEKPHAYTERPPVPGQDAGSDTSAPEERIFAMLNQARSETHARKLPRNPKLDELAQLHSTLMAKARRISHDMGDGTPGRRLETARLEFKSAGENVALAQTVDRLHRALWASPSHRDNLLRPSWDEVGIGLATGPDGRLYLTQLFVDL